MRFRLAHGPLHAQYQAVIEGHRIINAVLVHEQRARRSADLQQPVPVGAVAGQTRNLQAQHDSRMPQADFRYEPLKPFPVLRGGPRKAQIIVHHHDLLLSPAESYNPLLECILPSRALLVFDHLPGSRLPNIEVCLAIAVPGGYLGVSFHHTRLPPCAASGARWKLTPRVKGSENPSSRPTDFTLAPAFRSILWASAIRSVRMNRPREMPVCEWNSDVR